MTDQGALESQLAGLQAQREQLVALVGDDPHSPLIPLQEELAVAIDGIRERLSLLRKQAGENDEQQQEEGHQATAAASTAPPLPPPLAREEHQEQEPSFSVVVGALCLAPRVFDRRRARAVVEEVDGSKGTCLVTWVHPRQHGEIVCRYWKEGRSCKFSGPDCQFSHGIEVPLSGLLPDDGGGEGGGSSWLASLRSGSRVLARYHDRVWYEATAEGPATPAAAAAGAAASSMLAVRFKGFEDDGPVSVPADSSHLAPLEVAAAGPEVHGVGDDSDGGSPDGSEDEEEEESDLEDAWAADADAPGRGGERDGRSLTAEAFFQERVLGDRRTGGGGGGGGGARGAAAAGGGDAGGGKGGGLGSDAYVFGDWEQHTKGFGSRMMNRMGYRRGEGLGKEKQGISRPVPIRVLPERRALDHLRVDDGGGGTTARSVGGSGQKKKKKKKKDNDKPGGGSSGGGGGGMFNFLNNTMHASMSKRKAEGGTAAAASRLAGRRIRPVFDAGPSSSSTATAAGAGTSHPLRKPGVFFDKKKNGRGAGAGGGAGAAAAKMSQAELRSHLVGAREAEATLSAKIGRLQETISRNEERDPRTAAQARQKLKEVCQQAKEVRDSRGRAERALENLGGGGSGKGGGRKGGGKAGLFSF